jgi:hypothetical protein
MAAMDCRWAAMVVATARSWAADIAPGGLGSAGSDNRPGTAPASERALSVNPRSWFTNSSIDLETSPLDATSASAVGAALSEVFSVLL